MNKAILIGYLGKTPELRYTEDGTPVCNMRLATNESYTDADGSEVQKTQWHNVVAWDGLAEVCSKHLSKGSRVYFEGKLQTQTWTDSNGTPQSKTQVHVREMLFLDRKKEKRKPSSQKEPVAERMGQ